MATLTLNGNAAPAESVAVDTLRLMLPCQRFRVRYTVSQDTRMPLVEEFLLRLVRLGDTVSMEEAGDWFGFSEKERTHLIKEALQSDYVKLEDGRLALTPAGEALFTDSPDGMPRIIEAKEYGDSVDFDLVSFCLAPAEGDAGKGETRQFLSVQSPDRQKAARSKEVVEKAFQEHFQEFLRRYKEQDDSLAVNRVVSVEPNLRFAAPLDIEVSLRLTRTPLMELDFSKCWSRRDAEPRSRIREAVSDLVASMAQPPADWRKAVEFLEGAGGGLLTKHVNADGFDVAKFAKAAATAPETLLTRPIYGALWSERNFAGVRKCVEDTTWLIGTEGIRLPVSQPLVWARPSIELWGRGAAAAPVVESFKDVLAKRARKRASEAVLLSPDDGSEPWQKDMRRRFEGVFDGGIGIPVGALPSALEIMLVPGCMVAAMVHVPVKGCGLPLPVGFLSEDYKVVEEVQNRLLASVPDGIRWLWSKGRLPPADFLGLLAWQAI